MNLKEQDILQEFIDAKAVLKGHFILSSGLHSDTYMQCARVLMEPKRAENFVPNWQKNLKQDWAKISPISSLHQQWVGL